MRSTSLALSTMFLIACGSATPAKTLDAGSAAKDMAQAQAQDLTMMDQPMPDLSMKAGPPFGCASDIKCYNQMMCADQACVDACDGMVNTPDGLMLLNDLFDCLFGNEMSGIKGACPDFGGGTCDPQGPKYSASGCQTCVSGAQKGACLAQASACQKDG